MFLQGGPSIADAISMIPATTAGSGFAVAAVLLNRETGTMFDTGEFARTLALGVVIFFVNGTLPTTVRLKPFAVIPARFFGFASAFATYFGGRRPDRPSDARLQPEELQVRTPPTRHHESQNQEGRPAIAARP
ncbi:DUF1097 domain-containing protein [Streptomyces sp. MMG1533]|uniref:DUF1097 domain-containing protein n=1 Tax=Streptomyces sp. MMG1533 TaxID=1415546 RepID=UPI00099BF988